MGWIVVSEKGLDSNLFANVAVLEHIDLNIALFSPGSSPGILDDPVELGCIAHQQHSMVDFRIVRA